MIQENNFVPSSIKEGKIIHGVLAVVAVAGAFVQQKGNAANAQDAKLLELATGGKAYALVRDVVADDADTKLARFVHGGVLEQPYIVSQSECSAQKLDVAEFEGTGLLDASITDAVTATTEVTIKAGKIALIDADQEPCGVISRQLTPANGGAVRIEVSFFH